MFKRMESVYIGYDMALCGKILDALNEAGIKYKHKVHNDKGQLFGMGRGTNRGVLGNVGMNQDFMNQHEILVSKEDQENAEYIIRKIRE
ncbi:MAG: hypothetical protein ACI4S0_04010 [Dorea sp.]